jgi:hypothetical protein
MYFRGKNKLELDGNNGSTDYLEGAELKAYLENPDWVVGGRLRAGYFTEPGKLHPKWQGDDLEAWWLFLKQSEEARSCLVQRLAEEFLGPNQVYDRGWLNEISKDFRPGPNSGNAFKQVVASLVKSNTFRKEGRISGECYDVSSKSSKEPGKMGPPCEVAFILESKCAKCHNNTDNGVDLANWKMQADGKLGFTHLDAEEKPLPRRASYDMIMERLVSDVPLEKMPQSGELSEAHKQALKIFFDKDAKQ